MGYYKKISSLYSNEPCNVSRQPEIDMAKAVVACCLAAIHVFVECSTDEALDSYGVAYFFDSVLGGPMAAPMFMFSMGIGLAYSHDSSPHRVFRRGLQLLGLSYLLNFVRFFIPSILGYAITGDGAFYIEPLFFKMVGNDIWQFAGMAHLLMALLLYSGFSPLSTLNVGVILGAIAMYLGDINTGNDYLNAFLGYFIGIEDETTVISDFPLMTWFMIYTGGYVFGYYIMRLRDKDTFYKMVTLPYMGISITVMIIEAVRGTGMMGGSGVNVFYHMAIHEAFICMMFIIGLMGIYHFMLKKMSDKAKALMERISRSLMGVYFFQWTFCWWAVDFFIYIIRGDKYFDWPYGILLGAVLGFLSVLTGVWWTEKGKRLLFKK